MNQHNLKDTHKELRARLGTRFSTDAAVRDAHARDASYHRGAPPDAVAFPKTNTEVADIVKICAKHRIPIIPYGTGTGIEGAVVATEGTLCIALNEMNNILHVNPDDRDATVQAGVTRFQLNSHLIDIGTQLHFSCRSRVQTLHSVGWSRHAHPARVPSDTAQCSITSSA